MALTYKQKKAIIATHKKHMQKQVQTWNRYRRWYQSKFWGGEGEDLPQGAIREEEGPEDVSFETNYPYAFVDTMIANICPLYPRVTVNARRDELRGEAKVREALINETFRKNRTHQRLWKLTTHASVYQRGVLKVVWDQRRKRPKFRNIDPRRFFFDMSAEEWDEARYVVEVTTMTKDEFARMAKQGVYKNVKMEDVTFGSYPQWLRDHKQDASLIQKGAQDVFKWITIYEFYDLTPGGGFCHIVDSMEEPLFSDALPYAFVPNPFILLTLNDNLEDLGGMSDVQLIAPLQEQLNETDTLELMHARASIPIAMINDNALDQPDKFDDAWRNGSQPGSYVHVAVREPYSVMDALRWSQVPSMVPGFTAMRERATQTIEFILGIPQYSRGVVGTSDVATEVALADTATRTRNGRRQKQVYDVLSWLAEATVGLYEEFMPDNETLHIRLVGRQQTVTVDRDAAGFQELKAELGETPLDYDYEAVPYSSAENNRLVQLRNLRENWNALMLGVQTGTVDQTALMDKLLELLMMADIAADQSQAQAPMMPPGAFVPPGGEPAPTGGEDTIASGALPPGTEPVMPAADGGGAGAGFGAPTPVVRGEQGFPQG